MELKYLFLELQKKLNWVGKLKKGKKTDDNLKSAKSLMRLCFELGYATKGYAFCSLAKKVCEIFSRNVAVAANPSWNYMFLFVFVFTLFSNSSFQV